MLQRFLARNVWLVSLFLAGLLLVMAAGFSLYRSRLAARQQVLIATGEPSSQSYRIMTAVADLINAGDYDFTLRVVSTRGTVENAALMSRNLVQMAVLQADQQVGPDIRLVANLYENVFHFILRPELGYTTIEEVKDIKIAVPPANSGEYLAFRNMQAHFGLESNRLVPVVSTWKSATWLFGHGNVEALFRVREANHEGLTRFVKQTRVRNGAITQAAAIALHYPMYHRALIPRGAYRGLPPEPGRDIETLGVDMLLVATASTASEVVEAVARVLFTRQRELAEASQVAGLVRVPAQNSLIPWHSGLAAFVNQEKPNFFQQNAEFLALLLSIILFVGSSLLQFLNRSKQQRLNAYNEQLLSIKVNVEQTTSLDELYRLREEHFALVNQIVSDAVAGRITGDGFEFFAFAWNSVTRIISDKERKLTT